MKVEPAVSVKDGMTLREEVLIQWKELWRDFLRDTSLQGCKNIPCKKRHIIVRVIWLLLVLAMAGMLLSALTNLHNKYYSYNFTSKITRESRQRLRLPAITICNKNRIDTSKRNLTSAELKFVLQESSVQFMFKSVDWNGHEGRELDQIDHVKFWEDVSYEAKDMFKFIHLKRFHKASSMIYSKRWNRRCFTFDANAYDLGVENSLTLLINIMQGTYLNGATYEAGVEVYIHEAEETSYSQSSSVAVPVGLATKLKLSRKEMKYLPHPYNSRGTDCEDTKASHFVNSLEWFKHYSFEGCILEHNLKAATAACNCSAGWEPHNVEVNLRHCSIKEVEVCYWPAYTIAGGEMGLFLGAGILTIIELLELVTACVYVGFMSLWARHKHRTSPTHIS